MGLQNVKSVYPFSEMFEVLSQGDTAIDVMEIPEGTIIEQVLTRVKTPAVGASNLIIGDDDDDNGYILAADATAAAGTVYGEVVTERGAYLYNGTSKAGHVKLYGAAGKELKLVLSADPATSEGVYQVVVTGRRYDLS